MPNDTVGVGYSAPRLDTSSSLIPLGMMAGAGFGMGSAPLGKPTFEGLGRGLAVGGATGTGAYLGRRLGHALSDDMNMGAVARALISTLGMGAGGLASGLGARKLMGKPLWKEKKDKEEKVANEIAGYNPDGSSKGMESAPMGGAMGGGMGTSMGAAAPAMPPPMSMPTMQPMASPMGGGAPMASMMGQPAMGTTQIGGMMSNPTESMPTAPKMATDQMLGKIAGINSARLLFARR